MEVRVAAALFLSGSLRIDELRAAPEECALAGGQNDQTPLEAWAWAHVCRWCLPCWAVRLTARQSFSRTGQAQIPVECSQARGKEGADYLHHPDRPICSMPWTTFRMLYP